MYASTRQYNGGTVVTIAPSVNLFSLTPSSSSVQETYPGIATESGTASLLVDCTSVSNLNKSQIQSNQNLGQYFKPTVGSTVCGWRATSVQFMAEKQNNSPGTALVQMQPCNASLLPAV